MVTAKTDLPGGFLDFDTGGLFVRIFRESTSTRTRTQTARPITGDPRQQIIGDDDYW